MYDILIPNTEEKKTLVNDERSIRWIRWIGEHQHKNATCADVRFCVCLYFVYDFPWYYICVTSIFFFLSIKQRTGIDSFSILFIQFTRLLFIKRIHFMHNLSNTMTQYLHCYDTRWCYFFWRMQKSAHVSLMLNDWMSVCNMINTSDLVHL